MRRHPILIAALLAALTVPALAEFPPDPTGHVPELTPRPGEQRFNRFQYRAIHNAYKRDTTLTEQLDALNAMEVELDVRYYQGNFIVQHHCFDLSGSQSLVDALLEIKASQAHTTGFINIGLENDPNACSGIDMFCFDCFPANWEAQLRDVFLAVFPEDLFYTYTEFNDEDMKNWPSIQELIRRGRHIFVTGQFNNLAAADGFFFDKRLSPPPGEGVQEVLYNTDNANQVPFHGDQFISRHYPSSQSCGGEDEADYELAMANGFTYSSTNCDTALGYIVDPRMHPPVPMYVFPFTISGIEVGTSVFPYTKGQGLALAVIRVRDHADVKGPSTIPMQVFGGTYVLPASGVVLDAPVVLHAPNADVVITR